MSVEPEVSSISSRKMQVRFLVQDDIGPVILSAAPCALMAAYHPKFAFKEEDQEEGKLVSLRQIGIT